MNVTLRFPMEATLALVKISEASTERAPILENLFDPVLRHDGKVPILVKDLSFPTEADIDLSKLKPALTLVADRGVYLMSNAKDDRTVVYAKGCDPERAEFDDWYAVHHRVFGGDDGTIGLPVDLFHQALSDPFMRRYKLGFKVRMTSKTVRVGLGRY